MSVGIRADRGQRRGRSTSGGHRGRASGRGRAAAAGVGLAILLGFAIGCAGGGVSDVGQWADVPLNKVFPYPEADELAKRSPFVAVVEDRRGQPVAESETTGGTEDPILKRAWNQTRRTLDRFLEESGVVRVEPREPTLASMRAQWSDAAFLASKSDEETPRRVADYAVTVRFPDHSYSIKRKAPLRLPWEDDAEYEAKPGTCLYRAQIDVAVDLVERGRAGGPARQWRLTHGLDDEAPDANKKCPDEAVFKQDLFERTLDDMLECLRNPIQNRLSARGFILSKRKAPEGDRVIYETNLGVPNGAVAGGELAVYRASYSTSPDGTRVRSERKIADGTFTDQLSAQSSWITVDSPEMEILGGDVVRPRFTKGLVGKLTGPSCGSILTSE